MKSILDPSFRYTPSFKTDIRKTFARLRRQQGGKDDSDEVPVEVEVRTNVLPLKQRSVPKGQAS
jgi:hypothetical protein